RLVQPDARVVEERRCHGDRVQWVSQVVRDHGEHLVERACRSLGVGAAALRELEQIGLSKREARELAEDRSALNLVIAEFGSTRRADEEQRAPRFFTEERYDEGWAAAAARGEHSRHQTVGRSEIGDALWLPVLHDVSREGAVIGSRSAVRRHALA